MLDIFSSDVFTRHDTGIGHPENARRIGAALEGVERAGASDRLLRNSALHADTDRIIAKVHSAEYERELELACRGGMRLFHSMDNPISSASFTAARTAVGTSLVAADQLWKRRESQRAFIVARPPGHHAERA